MAASCCGRVATTRGGTIPHRTDVQPSLATTKSTINQTMMNEALRQYLAEADQLVTEKVLRQVLRQEMPEYLAGVTARSKTKSKI